MGGIAAPLYYASPGQINAQVPFELLPGTPYQMLVNANNGSSTPADFQVAFDSPGIAQFPNGQIITSHAAEHNNRLRGVNANCGRAVSDQFPDPCQYTQWGSDAGGETVRGPGVGDSASP
jgi:uncharacterized protein (TIGR03437 family)